ncbi:uncharacterized protein E5676_scaffold2750G00350 [Cucumis melo var. makuwa]|uniref:DUF4216 domain-containing protein n=1 Tax=Cucumis melo var. makuwa TaxID=1194695 RepID=A0A5D3BCI7_CUCMM|nr:uncharacterized protein E5676_scaffold2750G00350 [Cucumis melo var. makuwa]
MGVLGRPHYVVELVTVGCSGRALHNVETELATGDVEVSDNLRWIAHGPHPVVTTYNSYAINGCHYHTKSHDKNKTVQNSGVSLVAKTMQWWYQKDELGFVLVDLSRVGHKNDSFIFATQAKQVFFVEDPSDSRWSIVLTPPQRDFTDQYNDDELGDTVLNCQGMPKATIDIESILDLDENTPTYIHSYTMELPTDEDLTLGLDEVEIALNEESPNDALTQALGTSKYGGRVRGVDGFITPTVYFHQAKPRKSNKVDTTQQIIDENEALRKCIRELEQKVESIPTSEHGSCSKRKVQKKEKVLENVVKEKKGIATSVPLVSLTSKKKVVEEEEVKEEEVIATTPMTKNEVKSSTPMTKEVEVTSEPSNLPIQLKYILRYAERGLDDFPISKEFEKDQKNNILESGKVSRNSYSQLELDEVRVEWAEFLSRFI